MPLLTKPSGAFPTALIYITIGTLIDIWTVVALVYYPPTSQFGYFMVVGLLVTGLALLIIGLLLGPIGRSARHAELPPAEVTPAATQAEQNAAAHAPVLVPPNSAAQGAIPTAAPVAPVGSVPPVSAPVQTR